MLTKEQIANNFYSLRQLVSSTVAYSEQYLKMLNCLRDDIQRTNDTVYLGLERAPASTTYHHTYEGGLVQHIMEMWNAWGCIKAGFLNPKSHTFTKGWQEHLSDSNVLRGIIHHDLHKGLREFVLLREQPWECMYDPEGEQLHNLLTNDVKSLYILQAHGIPIDPELMNAVICAEGGWSKIRPQQRPMLGVLISNLDSLSGVVYEYCRIGTFMDEKSRVRGHG